MPDHSPHGLRDARLDLRLLPAGATGIDAGLTMTKFARGTDDGVLLTVRETPPATDPLDELFEARATGITGAASACIAVAQAVRSQEIEAAARGARALMASAGDVDDTPSLLTLLGTGTAFAAVRGDSVQHLGGAALGGGSFVGIARRIDAKLTYASMVAGAHRGDRRNVDIMVGDAYPDGIGRIGGDLTAAHLAGARDASTDDVLAGLLNLHGESIGQIAASRARIAGIGRILLAGGFAHDNDALVLSITKMCGLFGLPVVVAPHAGYAGAVGAGLAAVEAMTQRESSP